MKICCHCGKKMIQKDTYIENDKYLGVISIPNVKYYVCLCGEESISGEILQKVDEEYARLLSELLLKRLSSMNDINKQFIPNRELVAKLGKTRQAIAKDFMLPRRIFNIVLFGQRYYLRESVELFVQTGDGRFPLVNKDDIIEVETENESLNYIQNQLQTTINTNSELVGQKSIRADRGKIKKRTTKSSVIITSRLNSLHVEDKTKSCCTNFVS